MTPTQADQLKTFLLKVIELEKNFNSNRKKIFEKLEEFCNLASLYPHEILANSELNLLLNQCQSGQSEEKSLMIIGKTWNNITFFYKITRLAKELNTHNVELYFDETTGITYLKNKNLNEGYPNYVLSRKILLVGERDFTFAYSFGFTHKEKRQITLASAYEKFWDIMFDDNLWEKIKPVIWDMLENNMIIAFNVDATKLDQYLYFVADENGEKSQRFTQIQFNCPYVDGDDADRTLTKHLVKEFLTSAEKLLHSSGRIHVAIQQPPATQNAALPSFFWNKVRYQLAYGLTPTVVAECGLEFIKAIRDIEKRYANKTTVQEQLDGIKPIAYYTPYLGKGGNYRVNELVFGVGKDYHIYDNAKDSDKNYYDYDSAEDSDNDFHPG